MYTLSLHAQERRVERGIRDDDLAAALCNAPTLHLDDKTAHYMDSESGVVIVCLVPGRIVKTIFVAGQEG